MSPNLKDTTKKIYTQAYDQTTEMDKESKVISDARIEKKLRD